MIDEAIRHCLEVAENKEQAVYDLIAFGYSNSQEREDCQKCAEEHRQLAEWLMELKRARVLLKAAYELLEKQDNSGYVLNLLSETVYYDEAECDGNCLMKDIKCLLEDHV